VRRSGAPASDSSFPSSTNSGLALLGAGDDTFVWHPGDGSDTVEGQAGTDRMRFNGANVAEHIDLSANGSRLRFTRNVAAITMDTAGVERVDFNAGFSQTQRGPRCQTPITFPAGSRKVDTHKSPSGYGCATTSPP
jgi:Ca2+-binding RTX toxin-like protein